MAIAQRTDPSTSQQAPARESGSACLMGDVATPDRLPAREYTHTDVTGWVLLGAAWSAGAGSVQKWARPATTQGEPTIDEEMKVNFVGDAAVITGGNVLGSADSKLGSIKLRFTPVRVKENLGWKRRFFQAIPIHQTGS